MSEVVKYYDDFIVEQERVGINNRHLSIIYHLELYGLKRSHRVLEIGCGIGTVSELIARYLSAKGFLYSIDISPKSIALAKERLKKYNNVLCEVKDITKEPLQNKFDVVVLPDVIEHIPIEAHPILFKNILGLLHENGFVFIHIPHPNYLEGIIKSGTEAVQIIDQPIFTDELCSIVYPIGFYIEHLKSYSVYSLAHDYQLLILKKKLINQNPSYKKIYFQIPFVKKMAQKFRYVVRGLK